MIGTARNFIVIKKITDSTIKTYLNKFSLKV